jgi:hypothetical protein
MGIGHGYRIPQWIITKLGDNNQGLERWFVTSEREREARQGRCLKRETGTGSRSV